ncbi:hypothetical protein C0992_002590, partial [Termitomyces sp. T32_za158]
KTAREALGLDLTDQIVIIDEAHNLIPTILSLSTIRLPQSILMTSFMQVCTYVSKFRNRLSPTNLLHLKRLVVFLDALKKYVLEWKESRVGKSVSEMPGIIEKAEVITPAQFMERLGRKVSGINLLEIEKYLKTSKVAAIADLGQILLNFVSIVPSGMIVFFPSYNFLNTAKAVWSKAGLLDKFGIKKKIFFEPTESTDVDKVLQEYSSAIHDTPTSTGKARGALLLAVIGAKLSEGLNFADDLARAVVIVGLPFANLGSAELKERMHYVKRLEESRGDKKAPGQKDAAAELYENMCMNAVNQSIGRAIRHRGDWASLILLDRRYASSSIRNKLPKWIGNGITITEGFGQAVRSLGTFYRNKKQPS